MTGDTHARVPATVTGEARAPYFANLDCLRFFAFLGVFLCHNVAVPNLIDQGGTIGKIAHALAYNGARGVELFFVISGFIIIYLLIVEKTRTGTISLTNFYLRRTLRIWPLFYLIIGYVFLIKPALYQHLGLRYQYSFSPIDAKNHSNPWLWIGFLGNFDIFAVSGAPRHSELQVLWSLCVEEQFYLVTPVLLKVLRMRQIPYALAGGVVLGIALRGVFSRWLTPFSSNFDTLVLLDFFAVGGLLAYVVARHEQRLRAFMASQVPRGVELLFLGFVAYLLAFDSYDNRGFFETAVKYPLYAVVFAALILFVEFKPDSAGWLKRNRAFAYLGRISYGLYMFHMVVWTIVHHHLTGRVGGWGIAALSLALTVVVSAASSRWLEAPFLALRGRFRS